jgi:AcrR family transcriptional regulator
VTAEPPRPGVNEADPRVKRTRKLLQDAFVELLSEKPFEAITVQDIATRSTINRATFYAHFVDKYDLFAQFSREWFREAVASSVAGDAKLTTDTLRALARTTIQSMAEINDHCRPTEALKPLIMAAVQEELAGLLRNWLVPVLQAEQIESAVAAWSWAIFGAATQWSQSDRSAPPETAAARLAGLLMQGLTASAAAS